MTAGRDDVSVFILQWGLQRGELRQFNTFKLALLLTHTHTHTPFGLLPISQLSQSAQRIKESGADTGQSTREKTKWGEIRKTRNRRSLIFSERKSFFSFWVVRVWQHREESRAKRQTAVRRKRDCRAVAAAGEATCAQPNVNLSSSCELPPPFLLIHLQWMNGERG